MGRKRLCFGLAALIFTNCQTALATGIAPPDLGFWGNLLVYGGIFVIPIIVVIVLPTIVIVILLKKLARRKRQKNES